MSHLVLTGFRAFPGVPANPTQELVEHLRGDPAGLPAGARLELLDVDYRTAGPAIDALLADGPAALVLTGYSYKATRVTLEARATALCDPDKPDVCGHVPPAPVAPLPPLATPVDVAGLVDLLEREGIPAEVSHDAGAYLCNFSYRHALERVADRGLSTRVLFVHLPALEGSELAANAAGTLPRADMLRALALVAGSLAA